MNIQYGSHPSARLSLCVASADAPLVVFVHGGAWRDGAVENHMRFAQRLSTHATTPCSVALLSYRLSVPEKGSAVHPDHLRDVYDGLRYLIVGRPASVARHEYSPRRIVVVGHSVGAWFASAICFSPPDALGSSSDAVAMPTLFDVRAVRARVSAWVFLDGIYDIDRLLVEYPSYADFVQQAFQTKTSASYTCASLPSWSLDKDFSLPCVYITHSPDDELLTYRQSLIANYHILSLIHSSHPNLFDGDVISSSVPTPNADNAIAGVAFLENDPSLLPLPSFLNKSSQQQQQQHFSYSLSPYCNVDFTHLTVCRAIIITVIYLFKLTALIYLPTGFT